jgi:hypothetical protein
MSSAVRKYYVITPVEFERLVKRQNEKMSPDDETVERREMEVDEAMLNKRAAPDVRMKAFDQSIQQLKKARNDASKRKKRSTAVQTTTTTADTAPHSPVESEARPVIDDVPTASAAVEPAPKQMKHGRQLLGRLAQHKPKVISWTDDGKMLDERGQEVAGASAFTLAEFSMQKMKRALPTGWNLFATALVRAGVPSSEIVNQRMRQAMAQISAEKSTPRESKKRARAKLSVSNVY